MIKVTCLNCSKDFDVYPSRLKQAEFICCSRECAAEFFKAEPNVNCSECGKKFHVKPRRLERLKDSSHICCSKECSNKLKEKIYLGDKNHQFGLKGELNSSFKKDLSISTYGYICIRSLNHPFKNSSDFCFLHRLVMEENLRNFEPDSPYLIQVSGCPEKYLSPDVIVHHKDENKLNNIISNLEIMDLSEHSSLHNNLNSNFVVRDGLGRFLYWKPRYKTDQKDFPQLTKKNQQDAGLDIASSEDKNIGGRNSAIISTGIYMEIPEGHVGLIWSRSGISVKHKIEVGAGCIDASYRGELKVHLYNFGDEDFFVKRGDRIAQLLTIPVNLNIYESKDALNETSRGAGGFGSTGV